jgi:septal ring factor EnvC (AmiA/AmiB activator)
MRWRCNFAPPTSAAADEALKALIDTGDPTRLPRMLTYYGYVGRARTAQMLELDERAHALEAAESAVGDEERALGRIRGCPSARCRGVGSGS